MFKPKHVYIEKEALDYTLGKELKKQFEDMQIPVDILESNRVNFLRGKSVQEKYEIGKRDRARARDRLRGGPLVLHDARRRGPCHRPALGRRRFGAQDIGFCAFARAGFALTFR